MKQPITVSKHSHYMILAVILVVGMFAFLSLQGNRPFQFMTGVLTTLAYIAWGLVHHTIEGDLYAKIVVEYLLIGAIAIILLATVIGF